MRTKNYSIERKNRILDILEAEGRVEVEFLAQDMNVSKETIRRDLRELEEESLLKRTHGGAVCPDSPHQTAEEYPYLIREIQFLEEKEKICRKAASLIKNGDTIFIDNSSTNIAILKYINPEYSVTIITNSVRILLESTRQENDNFVYILLGGIFRCKNYSCTGDIANEIANRFRPSKAFISCYGIDKEGLLFDSSMYEMEVKKILLRHTEKVYITADHSKLGRTGGMQLSTLNQVNYLICDCPLTEEMQKEMDLYNVEVLVAE